MQIPPACVERPFLCNHTWQTRVRKTEPQRKIYHLQKWQSSRRSKQAGCNEACAAHMHQALHKRKRHHVQATVLPMFTPKNQKLLARRCAWIHIIIQISFKRHYTKKPDTRTNILFPFTWGTQNKQIQRKEILEGKGGRVSYHSLDWLESPVWWWWVEVIGTGIPASFLILTGQYSVFHQ